MPRAMLCLMYAYAEFNEACPDCIDFLAASLHYVLLEWLCLIVLLTDLSTQQLTDLSTQQARNLVQRVCPRPTAFLYCGAMTLCTSSAAGVDFTSSL